MKITIKNHLLIISIFILVGCGSKQLDYWPQFRGENSQGIAPVSANPPLELNLDKNLAWKVPLSSGLSSPCIFEGRIILTGSNPADSSLVTYCIDQHKGSLLWERTVFPDTLENAHSIGNSAAPTPTTDGSAIYVYFGSYGALCYDLEGTLLWEHRLPVLNSQYGNNGSPILHDSLLIINRMDYDKPSVIALKSQNGEKVWENLLEDVFLGTTKVNLSQATPIIWRDQVILHRGLELVSISLKDGTTKWTTGIVSTGVGTPIIINDTLFVNGWTNFGDTRLLDVIPDFNVMVEKYDNNKDKFIAFEEIPSEMAYFRRPELDLPFRLDTLYPVRRFARGFDSNNDLVLGEEEWKQMQEIQMSYLLEHGVVALKLDKTGESGKPVLVWTEKDYVAEVPSLVGIESRIYMVMNGGNVICMNSRTGEIIFSDRLRATGAYLASPLSANGYIYFASYNGKITVIKPGDKLNIIAQSDLKEKIAASPVALGNILYLRTDSALYAFKN